MTPILLNINAFDATVENIIKFTWNGDQSKANNCIIRNNESNEVVYNNIQTTYKLEHIIPKNTLKNGVCYNIRISVIDTTGEQSQFSNQGIFYCYSTPFFEFSNISENSIIQNSTFEWNLTYTQPEGEKLNEYQVYLYDFGKKLINQSSVKYNILNNSIFKGYFNTLEDNGKYYARATGVTLQGMKLDTGYIPFSVNYKVNSLYSYIWLENDYKNGYIKIQSNIKIIEGSSNPDPPKYIDDKEINLKEENSWVNFEDGFDIEKDFTLQIIGIDFNDYSEIVKLVNRNNDNYVSLRWMKGTFNGKKNRYYINLKASNKITCYTINSNFISDPSNKIHIFVQRKNNIYIIKIL